MSELRVVVIATTDKSDLYFANQLMKRVNVVGVMVENNRYERDTTPILVKASKLAHKPHVLISKALNKVIDSFRKKFADYHKPGKSVNFGEEGKALFADEQTAVIYTTGVNNINAPEYIEWLEKQNVDVVAICGASILGEKMLSIPKLGALNLHGGLAQKYRGLFTTDWAIHNEQPEYVGATIHYVLPGIDDGDIVYQGRPKIEPDDNPHSLYVKVVKLGINMMTQAIQDLQEGKSKSVPLPKMGALYLARMYTDRERAITWGKIKKGIVKDYLANQSTRDKEVQALMVNVFPGSY